MGANGATGSKLRIPRYDPPPLLLAPRLPLLALAERVSRAGGYPVPRVREEVSVTLTNSEIREWLEIGCLLGSVLLGFILHLRIKNLERRLRD